MKRSAKLLALRAQAKRAGWLRWIRSEADERAVLAGYYFNQERADHVLAWGPRYLRHTEGAWAGQPFEPMAWQRDELFAPLFGWVHQSAEWGREVRRFRKAYVQVPKKNGKSPTGAYVGLYMLVGDGEPGAKIYSAATDKEQASIVHGHAIAMIEQSAELARLLKVNKTTKSIVYAATNSVYRVISSNPRTNEGWNAHAIIADELHKWYGRQLYDALKWAFASRAEPLFFQITTAGDDPLSVCKAQYDYAKGVLAGTIDDPSFFPLVYEAGPDDDVADEATWKKANPSLGETIKLSDFRADAAEAKANPGFLQKWKQLRLNIWSTARRAWFANNEFAKCRRPPFADLEGALCYGGLDLSVTLDLTALALVFPVPKRSPKDKERYRIRAHFFLPEDTAKKMAGLVPYELWAAAEFLTLTPGSETDFAAVLAQLALWNERYTLRQLYYDPWNAAYLTQRAETELGIERVEFPPTIRNFAEPCAMFERLVRSQQVEHEGNPVLEWCVGNANVTTDANGNMRPVKPEAGNHQKIDGLVAALMALAATLADNQGTCAYDDDDFDVESI